MNHSDSHRATLATEAIDSFPSSQDSYPPGHADFFDLNDFNAKIRFSDLPQPLFFSLAVHFLIFLALLWGFYQPNRRPIKEVNVWMVSLVSEWNAEPKGIKAGNIEGATLAWPLGQGEAEHWPSLPVETTSFEQAVADLDVPIQPQEKLAASEPGEEQPIQSSSGKMEDRIRVMRDAAERQIQMGQYLFVMKAQDQMMGIKIRYFQKNTRLSLEGILKATIPEEERLGLQGKTAAVKVTFSVDGQSPDIAVAPESDPTLAAILEQKIDWRNVTPPSAYALPHKAMNVRVALNDTGNATVRVELL